jgi:hypothetical protein
MITFFGIFGILITILVAVPATLIAIATLIEHPIRTILALWLDLIETYKNLWYNITK